MSTLKVGEIKHENFTGTTQLKLDNSGRVLVGTTTEGQASADDLTINSSGSTGITIRSGSSNDGNLFFSDATSGTGEYAGYVQYEHANDTLRFGTASAERMRIDSSGRLLLGTTTEGHDNADNLTVADTGNSGITIRSGASSAGNIYFSDATSGGGESDGYIAYSQSINSLDFGTNQSTRMRIDSSGNVGIGNTTPGSFHSSGENLVIGSGSGDEGMTVYSGTGSSGIINFADGTSGSDSYEGRILYRHADNAMSFHTTNGTERMRIDSSGKVGIGNTSPSAAVEVTFDSGGSAPSSGTAPEGIAISYGTSDGKNGGIWFSPGFGDDQGISGIAGSRTSGYDTDLRFYTNNTGSARAFTERMRIDSDGNIGFSPNGIDPSSTGGITVRQSNPTDYGPVMSFNTIQSGQGFTEFRSSGTQIGSIGKSGTTGVSYYSASDYRLKENQSLITDGITRLKVLKPYKFNWKADASTKVDGFFAHEVTPAVPEAITGTKDEVDENNEPIIQQIDHSKLVPLLTAALQEAVGKIEVLETKVAALEAA